MFEGTGSARQRGGWFLQSDKLTLEKNVADEGQTENYIVFDSHKVDVLFESLHPSVRECVPGIHQQPPGCLGSF